MENLEGRGVYVLIHKGFIQFVWQISPLRNAAHCSGRNDNKMDFCCCKNGGCARDDRGGKACRDSGELGMLSCFMRRDMGCYVGIVYK